MCPNSCRMLPFEPRPGNIVPFFIWSVLHVSQFVNTTAPSTILAVGSRTIHLGCGIAITILIKETFLFDSLSEFTY